MRRTVAAGIGGIVTAASAAGFGVAGLANAEAPPPVPTTETELVRASETTVRLALLDPTAEQAIRRQQPARPSVTRPVTTRKPPKRPSKAKAKKVKDAVAAGADTPEAHLVRAYRRAPRFVATTCNIRPELLAAIGQVESGNIGGRSLTEHAVTPPIYGPPLTGGAFARIADSDGGRVDGSSAYDRAVGPMQFIPTTWSAWGIDADKDGEADPQNVYDAAATAARYLCAGGRDLSDAASLRRAILSYNYSSEYVSTVLQWRGFFERNGLEAIGSSARFVPSSTASPTTESRDKHADDPVAQPGPKDAVPTTPPAKPKPTAPTTPKPTSPKPTSPRPTKPPVTPTAPPPTSTPTTPPTSPPTPEPDPPSPTSTDPPAPPAKPTTSTWSGSVIDPAAD